MDALLWDLLGDGGHPLSELYLQLLVVTLVVFWDYPLLLLWSLLARGLYGRGAARRDGAQALPVLVVIPSLLRRRDELTSMQGTVQSIARNGYPGPLVIVVSIDGTADAPGLYRELLRWREERTWGERIAFHVTGTPARRGKPMAIDHAIGVVRRLVADGVLPAFPPVYVSTDADADLGPNALWAIVSRLQRRSRITGAPPNIVAGGLYVRGNDFWRGWRRFFSVEGQLTLQVAREYYVSNIGRYNLRALPTTSVPGAFYCTWSELFVAIPRYMGYLLTLRPRHWLGWWVGIPPPKFSESNAAPLPERVAGDTDDTVTAYLGSLARYVDGHFDFDPPATPLHALWYAFRSLFLARPIQYEPEARVFTSSPSTVRSLFRQRRRWNSSRVELTLRLWRAMGYHWVLGLPAMVVQGLMARSFLVGLIAYVYVPVFLFRSHLVAGFVLSYACQALVFGTLTLVSLVIRNERSYWRIAYAIPLSPVYNFAFNWVPAAVGLFTDVFLFGNVTGFAPEWTLKRGRSVRIALLFRLRRAFLLTVRSARYGDVTMGRYWLGWAEGPGAPSGFEGWTTGKRPSILGGRPAGPPRPAPRRLGLALLPALLLAVPAPVGTDAAGAMSRVSPGSLRVESGTIGAADGRLILRDPTIRAVAAGRADAARLDFRYLGPSEATAPLASGELRRQIGLKLRARDTCNAVYVMWHIAPTSGIRVEVKMNPTARTHQECRDAGYRRVAPAREWLVPPIRPGERRSLVAELAGKELRVLADGALAWEGTLPDEVLGLEGPAGIRSDNGQFDAELWTGR